MQCHISALSHSGYRTCGVGPSISDRQQGLFSASLGLGCGQASHGGLLVILLKPSSLLSFH